MLHREKGHSQQLDSGQNKKLRWDHPSYLKYKGDGGRFQLTDLQDSVRVASVHVK